MKLYGLIGFPLTHSFSKKYFTEKFQQTGIDNCLYENFPLENIDQIKHLLNNTDHGKLKGFNTDVVGFENSIKNFLKPYHTKALIFGTGGAAKAVEYVLQKLNIDYLFVSRKKGTPKTISYHELKVEILQEHLLLINTTPLGMYPKVDDCPDIAYDYLTPQHHLYDLVYNPEKTLFLQKGEMKGATIQNGYEMLILQAEESWRIWNESEL
ncbi:MAG: shikimate dehydrogenase [Sphingobacteriales bacterium]|nr:shikimate dehydrogenase [Sphingobacteriales bacterium]